MDVNFIEGEKYAEMPDGRQIKIPGCRLVSEGGMIEMCQHPYCFTGDERVKGQAQIVDKKGECRFFEIGIFGRVKLGIDDTFRILFDFKLMKQKFINFFYVGEN